LGEDPLKIVIDLIRSGQGQRAQETLRSMLKADVHNIPAWFWYVETCTSVDQRIQALEACLICNPDNSQVKSVLNALRQQQAQSGEGPKAEARPLCDETRVPEKMAIPSGVVTQTPQKPAVKGSMDAERQKAGKPIKRPIKAGTVIMWLMAGGLVVAFAYLVVNLINSTPIDPTSHRFTQPIEYYLYVPKAYAASQQWPLFIGIHGSGGSGLDCWNLWQPYAEREGFILLCPTMPDEGGGWQQNDGEAYTWAAISAVTGQYNIKPRYFLTGFSAGAAFVQGFAIHYPQYVEAVAVLSAGVYRSPSQEIEGIPFLIVIGNLDNPESIGGSQQFAQALANNGNVVSYWLLPFVGHQVTNKGRQLTIDFFHTYNH